MNSVVIPDLWPIQIPWFERLKDRAHAVRRVLAQAPTGFGKTTGFSRIVAGTIRFKRSVWLVCHRDELIQQISKRLTKYGIKHGFIARGYVDNDEPIKVCSQQTLRGRLDWLEPPDLLIWDEAHHIVSATAMEIIDFCADSMIIGVTATPERLDGKGLDNVFTEIVLGPQIKELIPKYLVQPVVWLPPHDMDLSGVRKNKRGDWVNQGLEERIFKSTIIGNGPALYYQHAPGTQAVTFCISLKHCERAANQFNDAGIKSAVIDGTMSPAQRQSLVAMYERREIQNLVSCMLISEGFDCPGIQTVIDQQPTNSLTLQLQKWGRSLRRDFENENKTRANIIDQVGNVWEHGFPDDDREWTIKGSKKASKEDKAEIAIRRCPKCHYAFRPAPACPDCGYVLPVKEREIVQVDGQLILTTSEQRLEALAVRAQKKRSLNNAIGKAKTKKDFEDIAIERGFKNPKGWAEVQFARRYTPGRKKA